MTVGWNQNHGVLRLAVVLLFLACGRTEPVRVSFEAERPDGGTNADAGMIRDSGTVTDAGMIRDSGTIVDAGFAASDAGCSVGVVASTASATQPALFGVPVWFLDGGVLPPGTYELRYRDGCMKYAPNQAWTIHAYADGADAWWIIDGNRQQLLMPPGTVGFTLQNGGFAQFDDCVNANRALPSGRFTFAGGVLGLLLVDVPYEDNVVGEGGRNPTWELLRTTCTP